MTTTKQQINTAADTTTGLSRMDDAEYEATFSLETTTAGTPRPGTSDADIETAIKGKNLAVWSFSQAAKQHAADVKRRRSPKSRTVYRMGVNTLVKNAIQHLKKKLDETLEDQSAPHLSEQDFNILKQGIENFRVKIIMDDSITLEELAQMREANRAELTKMQFELQTIYRQYGMYDPTYIQAKNKNAHLLGWDSALTAEVIRVRQTKGATPSQHAQISPNDSGVALSNILDPHTIHSKFTSLHNLTKQIRQELIVFLTSDTRVSDRVEVVKQIKEACIAARAAKKVKEAA